MAKTKNQGVYKKFTIEAALGGWVLKESNKTAEVFVRWETLIRKLESELTSKGEDNRDQVQR